MAALGVVLLTLGAFVEVLDLSMAAIASLTVVFAVIELRGKYPYLVYLTTATLSLLLLPSKTPALLYALFAGYYPMLKAVLEKRFSRPVSWLFKILVFNAALALIVLGSVKLLWLGELVWQPWYVLVFPLGTAVFCLYDVALTRLITVYLWRWRGRFRFLNDD